VYVYDARGRRVWQTDNFARAGGDNIVLWDGRDNRGRLAANGLYIIIVTGEKNSIIAKGRLALYDD
jgi:flagellar hook assembly protein FlgD